MSEKTTGQPVPLPAWYRICCRVFVGLYLAVAGACVVGVFLLMAIGAIVYRDFSSYSLAGNPWDESSFPWYVIWPMRLITIVGIQVAVAVGFGFLFFVLTLAWPARVGSPLVKRIAIGSVAALIELAAAAWFGRWFG